MAPEKTGDEKSPLKPIEKPKKKRKPFRSTDRWLIVGIFLLTVLTSLVFYLKNEVVNLWQRIASPLVISNITEKESFDPSPVFKEIESLTENLRGVYGFYVYRFVDNREYGIHQNETFPAASLMKLPVILTLYQEAQLRLASWRDSAGQADFLETEYKLIQEDKRSGAGILQGKPAGTVYTYRQLAEFMGQYSDNTANNVLVKVLGAEKIQETIGALGMEKTSFKDYTATPEDIGLFFRKLYQGGVVNQEHRDEILKILTKTGFEDRIPAGVPEGVRVAHKIGTEIGVFSDAGIVFSDELFILVVMSKNTKEVEAKEILPKITKAVWEFETKE